MAEMTDSFLREELLTRRQKLQSAASTARDTEGLVQLLNEVDEALGRMDAGTYGLCESCHESIEKGRLITDPLVRYCLDHLTSDQQRALEEDLQLAAEIQRELLPRPHMALDGWEAAHHYEPLGPVSGDYCDVVSRGNGLKDVFFLIGDASGKGIAASMLMSHLHAIFRTLIATAAAVPEIVGQAGRIFCETTLSPLFATLICARGGASGEAEICNAGHCPALWLRKDGVTRLEATGLPLGMFSTSHYAAQKIQMAPGDALFLYTDGLSEARSGSQKEYGEARITEVLKKCHGLPSAALIQTCLEDVRTFRVGAPRLDDLTLMAVRRTA